LNGDKEKKKHQNYNLVGKNEENGSRRDVGEREKEKGIWVKVEKCQMLGPFRENGKRKINGEI
jgi:hypothetical protein